MVAGRGKNGAPKHVLNVDCMSEVLPTSVLPTKAV